MEINEALKFFRKKLGFTQKEILPEGDASVYSRIESGKQELKVADLKKIMETLSLTPEEVFSMAPLDKEQKEYLKIFYFCAEHLNHSGSKKKLLTYYTELKHKNKNLREWSNYIAIKNCFSLQWQEIENPSIEEVAEIYQYLIKKSSFQYYDLRIIMNLTRFFESKQIDDLMEKIIQYSRNPNGRYPNNPIFNIFINVITIRVYEKNYESAKKYIRLAKSYDEERQDFYYRINIKYLENLVNYLESSDYHYLQQIYQYIDLLKDIKVPLAEQIETEVKLIIHGILDNMTKNYSLLTLIQEKEIFLAKK